MAYPAAKAAGDQVTAQDFNDYTLNPKYTYGETIAVGDALYLKASDGKAWKADADVLSNVLSFIGFAAEAGVANDTKYVVPPGKVATGLTSLTAGKLYYLSNTAGGISLTTGTRSLVVGLAISTTTLLVLPKLENDGYGDKSDGDLTISSGTTTLNTSGKNIYQWGDVAITGTGALATGSNLNNLPLIGFVNGDLTITSSATPAVSRNGAGGPAGSGGASGVSGGAGTAGATANVDNNGGGGGWVNNTGGGGGGGGSLGNAGTTATAVTSGNGTAGAGGPSQRYNAAYPILRLLMEAFVAGGGGGGAGSTVNVGTGGNGGAAGGTIILIVRGNINLTGILEAKGANGSAGSGGDAGGGGGGGGGVIFIFYSGDVTANSATYTVSAGTGGAKAGNGGVGGAGGAGLSLVKKITADELMF